MQIISFGDNLHEMSKLMFWENTKNIINATQQAHDVNATSDQRRYNVMTFMQRRVNVGAS